MSSGSGSPADPEWYIGPIEYQRSTTGPLDVVRPPASYELVVDQVRRAIQLGRFDMGTRLPAERELAQQLGVSRTTVREAIRVLQGEGLVEVQRGRNGGAVVIAPSSSREEIALLLNQRLAELEVIVDFRLIVEPASARLAAERRSSQDLARLRSLVKSMDELVANPEGSSVPSRFFSLDSQFHHQIAQAAGNPMLVSATDDVRARLFAPIGGIFLALHPSANELHRELFQSIEAKDATGAESTMRQHIALTRDALFELAGESPPAQDRD
jgi:GntR family transcriptional regulator, transcriptional repressor for pyruvate dehydrogenase complex